MNTPSFLPVLVPALGLLVPFLIRWIENRSRLKQAQHLIQLIRTRHEIRQLLSDEGESSILLQKDEEYQLHHYLGELDKETRRKEPPDIRLYPILISLEIIFFVSAVFSGFIGVFRSIIYAQGNETLPFLEGIFSNPIIRIGLLMVCLLVSLALSYWSSKKMNLRKGKNLRGEFLIFMIFNLYFFFLLFGIGLVLFLLDLIMPWF